MGPKCKACGGFTIELTSTKQNENFGKKFIKCKGCQTFIGWADASAKKPNGGVGKKPDSGVGKKPDSGFKKSPGDLELVLYTDGACKGNNNVATKVCPAGWGVAAFQGAVPVIELYGPVVLDNKNRFFLGATIGSNNTAELSAIGEALLFIQANSDSYKKYNIVIKYDSDYAAKSVQRIYNGKKNQELINRIRVIYDAVGTSRKNAHLPPIEFEFVKGHSHNVGNDRADYLANIGSIGSSCSAGRYAEETLSSHLSSQSSSSNSTTNPTSMNGTTNSTTTRKKSTTTTTTTATKNESELVYACNDCLFEDSIPTNSHIIDDYTTNSGPLHDYQVVADRHPSNTSSLPTPPIAPSNTNTSYSTGMKRAAIDLTDTDDDPSLQIRKRLR